MKPEIEARFRDAAQYDSMMSGVFPGYDLIPDLAVSYLRTKVGDRARVLDVGCGTGTTIATLARRQPAWSLVGVDPAEAMIELARAKVDELDAGDRIRLAVGTVDDLPDDEPFDAATMILVEHLLPDDGTKQRVLESVVARLAPGGWLVLAGLYGDFSTARSRADLEAWLELLALRGFPEPVRDNVRNRATVEDSLSSEARLAELLRAAGFASPTQIYRAQLLGAWLASAPPGP